MVLGGGGYVAGPMVLAARLRGIPAALTEADAHLGLANRLAAPFARRVFLAYDVPGRTGARYEVVGRPIPVAHRGATRAEGRARFGLPATGDVVAVFGALAGARSLNEMAVDAWGAHGPAVLHVCGERDYPALRERVSRPGYVLVPQTDHFGEALAAADLAVSRAGGTVWELAAAGTPAVLVPYPHATADHQTLNARHFEQGGGAVVVPDAEVGSVPALVDELLADPARLDAHARVDAGDGAPRRGRRDRGAAARARAGRAAMSGHEEDAGEARPRPCRAGGCTSSASAGRASPRTPTWPAPSAPRYGAGTCATRSSWARSPASRSTSAASRHLRTAGR